MKVTDKQFSDIVRAHSECLYHYIRRMVVSHEDTQDILQETFLKAYRSILFLRKREALRSWLYRIATNETKRFLSKKYHQEDLQQELCRVADSETWIDTAAKAELELQKAILGLPSLQRSVFCLRYYDELDYECISSILGSSPDSLKVSYHLAKEKVKKYIGDKEI